MVGATFTGSFQGGRSAFGDGAYQYQLDLENVERISVVSESSALPEALRPDERARVCKADAAPMSGPLLH